MISNSSVTLVIGAAMSATFLGTTGRAKSHINRLGEDIARLRREQRALTGGRLSGGGRGALVTQEVGQLMQKIDQLEVRKQRLEKSFERMSSGKEMMGGALKSIGAMWAGSQLFLKPIQAASAFEDAMLGVAKQMDGARDAQGNLTPEFFQMRDAIQAMGREIPMATNELAEMTAAGLRMGVAKNEVLGFVRTSAMMSTAFEMPAGELAEQMGKVAKIYGIPTERIGDLADSINYLDDNAISKGGDIINVLQRIGGTASMLGMSAKDAAALGSTFLTLGASAEVAATASNAVMRELSTAALQGDKFTKALGEEGLNLGLTPEELQKAMAIDATGTIMMVLRSLSNLPKEKRLTIATLMFGKEYGDDVAKLAGGYDEYYKQFRLANSAEAKGSMAREAAARDNTASAQWQLLKNNMKEAMVTIGDQLMPAAQNFMKSMRDALGDLTEFAKNNGAFLQNLFQVATKVVSGFVAAKVAMLGLGAVTYVMGSVSSGYQMFRENLVRAGDALEVQSTRTGKNVGLMKRASGELRGLGADMARVGRGIGGALQRAPRAMLTFARANPLGVLMAASATLTYLVYSRWDSILQFFQERFPVIGEKLAKIGEWLSQTEYSALEIGSMVVMVMPLLGALAGKLGVAGKSLLTLGGTFMSLGKLVISHPLLLAVGLLATAAFLVYKNWEPIKTFFGDLWDGISQKIGDTIDWLKEVFGKFRDWMTPWVDSAVSAFGLLRDGVGKVFDSIGEKLGKTMEGVQKASAWVEEKMAPAKEAYWSVRTGLSDGIEGLANLVSGAERARIDAPVLPARALPPVTGRAQPAQQNTVTINVNQQPGESGEALAQRIAQAQARALAVRNRGGLYDHAVAY